ncbi:MAG: UDP-N-acetylmuramoyl-L-alanyl-D-glutamate--2,6-diaminopimelate ligase [Desulfonatronovibrionaceae bacterium]
MDERHKWQRVLEYAADRGRIRIDSRRTGKGDIFVALPGTHVHGIKFVPRVLDSGAAFAVVSAGDRVRVEDRRIVRVPDSREALGELARAAYQTAKLDMQIIGITGTNGKTSCTYLLEHLLFSCGYQTGVIGTVEYRWPGVRRTAGMTTPDCLQTHALLREMADCGVKAVCMEVSSHALEQNRLAGVDFDAAVFTNLTREHLDYHSDMDSYFQAKKKLFFPARGKRPAAVVNSDDLFGRELAAEIGSALTYGLQGQFEPALKGEIIRTGPGGLELRCFYQDRSWEIKSPLVGEYNASNLLAAAGIGLKLGLAPEDFRALEKFPGIPGRLQKVPNDRGKNMFVDYAHTPDALENCCRALRGADFTALVVVFGCGGNRDRQKRPLMGGIACRYADTVVVTSDNPRDEDPEDIIQEILAGTGECTQVFVQPDRRQAIRLGLEKCPAGGALLVAGKGHETYQEVRGERREFDDAKVLAEVGNEI